MPALCGFGRKLLYGTAALPYSHRPVKQTSDSVSCKADNTMKLTYLGAMSLLFAASMTEPRAQQPPPATTAPPAAANEQQAKFDALPGRWVRVEGGYVISIKAVGADGRLDAEYANPRPLPFAIAAATSEGSVLKLFFELRAGGYGGSTYTLVYDPPTDRLLGVYDQVVVHQKFDVVFVRARP